MLLADYMQYYGLLIVKNVLVKSKTNTTQTRMRYVHRHTCAHTRKAPHAE